MDTAIVAMARDYTFSRSEAEMEARVINWGISMRGGYPESPAPDETVPNPNLLDAFDAIEPAMCQLKAARFLQYTVMHYLYVRGRSMQEAANLYRRPESWVQDRNREGLRWLINYFGRRVGA